MHSPKLSEVHPLVWIILFAIALRVGIMLFAPPSLEHTAGTFNYNLPIAQSLAEGEGFGETRYIAPGFPLLLTILDIVGEPTNTGVRILQTLLQILLVIGTYIFTKLITTRRDMSLIAAILAAAYPLLLLHIFSKSPDLLFSVLLLYSLIALIKEFQSHNVWYGVGAGILMACSALTDPFWLYLPLAVITWVCITAYIKSRKQNIQYKHIKSTVISLGVFLISFVLVLSPWVARNVHVFGDIDNSPFVQKQIEREAFHSYNFKKVVNLLLPTGWPTLTHGFKEMLLVPYGLDALDSYTEISYRRAAVELIRTGQVSEDINLFIFTSKMFFSLIYWVLIAFAVIGAWKYRQHFVILLGSCIFLYALLTTGGIGMLSGIDSLSTPGGFFFHLTPLIISFAAISLFNLLSPLIQQA